MEVSAFHHLTIHGLWTLEGGLWLSNWVIRLTPALLSSVSGSLKCWSAAQRCQTAADTHWARSGPDVAQVQFSSQVPSGDGLCVAANRRVSHAAWDRESAEWPDLLCHWCVLIKVTLALTKPWVFIIPSVVAACHRRLTISIRSSLLCSYVSVHSWHWTC